MYAARITTKNPLRDPKPPIRRSTRGKDLNLGNTSSNNTPSIYISTPGKGGTTKEGGVPLLKTPANASPLDSPGTPK